jgi:hypothetical protein
MSNILKDIMMSIFKSNKNLFLFLNIKEKQLALNFLHWKDILEEDF